MRIRTALVAAILTLALASTVFANLSAVQWSGLKIGSGGLKIGNTSAFDKFVVTASTGALASKGNLTLLNGSTTKFGVVAASGNTTIAGTLAVTGATTHTGALTQVGAAAFRGTVAVGHTDAAGTVTVTNTAGSATITMTGSSGNVAATTLNVTGVSTLGPTKFASTNVITNTDASETLTAALSGSYVVATNTAGATTVTLPDPSSATVGCIYHIIQTTDNDLIVVPTTANGNSIVCDGVATSDSVTISTASHKIGAGMIVIGISATQWYVGGLNPESVLTPEAAD